MRASKRHGVSVNEDGTLTGVDGVRRCLLRVPGLPLDAHAEPAQDRYAYLFGALAASLPHKARLAVFIENRPADAMALVAGLRAQLAPVPYTPQLGELGDRMLAWWARRLRGDACGQRHVATLDYWLLIDPWPAREGFPDTSDEARLQHAVDALTRHLVAMGIPPTRADVATARAFVARHLDRQDAGVVRDARGGSVIYTAPTGEESIHAYRTIDRRTGEERWRRTLYLVQPPVTTAPGWLRPLVASDSPATIVIHLRGLKRSWERRRQAWRLKMMAGTRTSADITTGLAATEAEEQATALHQQGYGISNVGLYVRLEGATRAQLDSRVGRVLMALRDGMIAEPGYGHAHQRPLYRSTLPGYGNSARSTYRWDSVTWGQAFPFMTFNPGTRTLGCPLGTTEAAGDLVTLALDDPNLYNRVGVILGRVGTGKTSLLQKLALHFLLRGDMATVVSSVDSFRALCAISGGQRATLGGTASATLNVWTSPHDTEEERREGVRFVCAAIDLLLGGLTDLEPAVINDGRARRLCRGDRPGSGDERSLSLPG